MADQGQEKTEQASSKKLRDQREEGKVAKSQEISAFAVFGTGLLLLFAFQGFIGGRLGSLAVEIFNTISTLDLQFDLIQLYMAKAFLFFFITLSPFFIGLIVFALASNIAQVGFQISPKALMPKFSKMNPIEGIKNKFFSSRSLVELVKSVAKLVVVSIFIYFSISSFIWQSTGLMSKSVEEIVEFMSDATLSFLWKIILVYAVISIGDFIFQKYKFKKDMMMTKEEVKEETKQTFGDPKIKGKIKQKQFEMSRNRMIAEVPKADVVITNPTHFAIAIKYESGKNAAPVVLAKGMDEVALVIKEIARKNNIPMHEDRPLAQALFKACKIGEEIPEKLFEGVAKILAMVYKARKKKKKSIV